MNEYFESIGLTMASPNAYHVLNAKYQINRKQFYYLRGKMTKNSSMADYIKELR